MDKEKFLKKLEKLLGKAQLDDAKSKEILEMASTDDELVEEEVVETPEVDENGEKPEGEETVDPKTDEVEQPKEETPVDDAPVDDVVPPVEETKPAEEGEQQPTVEETPTFDAEAKYEEVLKANEGLAQKLNALEDALVKAGVLVAPTETKVEQVGVENTNTSTDNQVAGDLSDSLARLNK